MPDILSDDQIAALLREPKRLPANWSAKFIPTSHQHSDSESCMLDVEGENGTAFRLRGRRNPLNQLDFSVLLTIIKSGGAEIPIVRYNGPHPSEHTNTLERQKFKNSFHIHRATERYQLAGLPIDRYAEVTTRYSSFETAVVALLEDNGFVFPDEQIGQQRLFSGDQK